MVVFFQGVVPKSLNFQPEQSGGQGSTPPGGGDSSILKVPGDVPPTRVSILVDFSLGKGMLFGNFGQRTVKVR